MVVLCWREWCLIFFEREGLITCNVLDRQMLPFEKFCEESTLQSAPKWGSHLLLLLCVCVFFFWGSSILFLLLVVISAWLRGGLPAT